MEPERDPTVWTYVGAIVMALLGGLVKYLQKIRKRRWHWSWKDATVDLLGSALAGLVTMLWCYGAGIDPYTSGALAGVAGHLGSRVLGLWFNKEKP